MLGKSGGVLEGDNRLQAQRLNRQGLGDNEGS
jgi:hypothetical protein